MKPIINKNGDVSGYGLMCGYVQRCETKTRWITLFMEHAHYHVRSGYIGYGYNVWDTFYSGELTQARKLYNKLKKSVL